MSAQPRRILIVEDTFSNGKMLEAKLLNENFAVDIAVNGGEAMEKIDAGAFSLVLLDVMMPGIDGFEVCRRIRAHGQAGTLPVIMITALDMPSAREAGRKVGADDFFIKPVEDAVLFERMHDLIGAHETAHARLGGA